MASKKTIKAAFIGNGVVELREIPRPNLEEGAVRVQMKSSGICGTDLEKLSGEYVASIILGHEVAGIVSESRSELFNEGDRVVPHHHVACGKCFYCERGAETMCDGFRNSNFDPCGFSEEFRVPEYNVKREGVHRIVNISFEDASFAEPLACCIRALDKVVKPGSREIENVLVVGAGPIGLLHMELLGTKIPEAKVVSADVSRERLHFAEKIEGAIPLDVRASKEGAFSQSALKEIEKPAYDLAIIATGNSRAFSETVRCVRKSGTVLLFGAPAKGSSYSLDLQSFLLTELTFKSSYATTEKELDEAIELLETRSIDVRKFITSIYPLERVNEAMKAASSESEIKVLISA